MDAPEPAVTPGSTQPLRPKLLPRHPLCEPGLRGALFSPPQAPASQPQQVPAQRVWAGHQEPRGPHLWGHKAQESRHPAVPSLPQFPPSGESGGWLTQNSAVAQVKAQLNKAHAQMCPRRPARAHARARRPAPARPAGAAPAGAPRRVSAPGSPGSGSVAPQAQVCTERRRGRVSRNAWGAGTEAEVGHSREAVMGARPRSLGCGPPPAPSRGPAAGRGLRRSRGVATRLALPHGARSAKPRPASR